MEYLNTGGILKPDSIIKAIKHKIGEWNIGGVKSLTITLPSTIKISEIVVMCGSNADAQNITMGTVLSNTHTTHTYPTKALALIKTSNSYTLMVNRNYYSDTPVLTSNGIYPLSYYIAYTQTGNTATLQNNVFLSTLADKITLSCSVNIPAGSTIEIYGTEVEM